MVCKNCGHLAFKLLGVQLHGSMTGPDSIHCEAQLMDGSLCPCNAAESMPKRVYDKEVRRAIAVSMCKHCGCGTHTIFGHCGKCKKQKDG
jgi:hypothetical protein